MKKLLCLILVPISFSVVNGQSQTCTSYLDDTSGQQIYKEVDQMPKFTGSNTELKNYIAEKLGWPVHTSENELIVASYIIDEKGTVRNVKLLRKSKREGINDRVIHVLQEMPLWVPGKCEGKPVKVEMVLPIKFSLSN